MHLETYQLAAYLDDALDEAARAEARAHMLTCPACAARLERMRADARRITAFASASPAPDVRAAVRAKLRRSSPAGWLLRAGALAGALAALFLFALLIGLSSGTVGRIPDRLFVVDQAAGQLVELDPASGKTLRALEVGERPSEIRYDRRLDRLYVMLSQAVVGVNARTLSVVNQWHAPISFGVSAGMALDEARGRLYVAQPTGVVALDAATLSMLPELPGSYAPGPLALSPDGRRLFTIDQRDSMLWTIELPSGRGSALVLDRANIGQRGWLAMSADDQTLYVLLNGGTPSLRSVDIRSGQVHASALLGASPPVQDLLLLDAGHLAIARGNGSIGGIQILTTDTFALVNPIDPNYDQHHLAAGSAGTIFGLNFGHNTVTRYDTTRPQPVTWRVEPLHLERPALGRPWDGVFVAAGWRWPW
jgi:DNA-binding beta-propeller fold protein YncE